MRVIALVSSSRYQLFSEAMQRKIVGTEGTIKVLLPEYQVYKCFIMLNNCAIQNCRPISYGFLVLVGFVGFFLLLNCFYYYTSVSFFIFENMTVVLLVHPKINCMTIPPGGASQ